MNTAYCMSLGLFMLATGFLNKDRDWMSLSFYLFGVICAFFGGMK